MSELIRAPLPPSSPAPESSRVRTNHAKGSRGASCDDYAIWVVTRCLVDRSVGWLVGLSSVRDDINKTTSFEGLVGVESSRR